MDIKTVNLTDVAEEQIIEYIKENNLRPGDQLPHESELGEKFDVGRNILREGLSRLRMLGIVESRRRRGMCVTQPEAFRGFGRVLKTGLLEADNLDSLMELRVMLEIGLAPYVTLRADQEFVNILYEICRREEKARSSAIRLECEIEFHYRIYQQVGNPLLIELQDLLVPFFERIEKNPPKRKTQNRSAHTDLVEAIERADPELYAKRIISHLKLYFPEKQ